MIKRLRTKLGGWIAGVDIEALELEAIMNINWETCHPQRQKQHGPQDQPHGARGAGRG